MEVLENLTDTEKNKNIKDHLLIFYEKVAPEDEHYNVFQSGDKSIDIDKESEQLKKSDNPKNKKGKTSNKITIKAGRNSIKSILKGKDAFRASPNCAEGNTGCNILDDINKLSEVNIQCKKPNKLSKNNIVQLRSLNETKKRKKFPEKLFNKTDRYFMYNKAFDNPGTSKTLKNTTSKTPYVPCEFVNNPNGTKNKVKNSNENNTVDFQEDYKYFIDKKIKFKWDWKKFHIPPIRMKKVSKKEALLKKYFPKQKPEPKPECQYPFKYLSPEHKKILDILNKAENWDSSDTDDFTKINLP